MGYVHEDVHGRWSRALANAPTRAVRGRDVWDEWGVLTRGVVHRDARHRASSGKRGKRSRCGVKTPDGRDDVGAREGVHADGVEAREDAGKRRARSRDHAVTCVRDVRRVGTKRNGSERAKGDGRDDGGGERLD